MFYIEYNKNASIWKYYLYSKDNSITEVFENKKDLENYIKANNIIKAVLFNI